MIAVQFPSNNKRSLDVLVVKISKTNRRISPDVLNEASSVNETAQSTDNNLANNFLKRIFESRNNTKKTIDSSLSDFGVSLQKMM